MMRPNYLTVSILVVVVSVLCASHSRADDDAPIEQRIAQLVRDLDADQFSRRETAVQELTALSSDPRHGAAVAAQLQSIVLNGKASLEANTQLERVLNDSTAEHPTPPDKIAPSELSDLMRQLTADSFMARSGAQRRIRWLLRNPKLICPVMLALKGQLDDPHVTAVAKRQLEPLYELSREHWLESDPALWELPVVAGDEIQKHVSALVTETDPTKVAAAEAWLKDVVAQERYQAAVSQHLQQAAKSTQDAIALERLIRLDDWLKPAMVAEIWRNHRQITAQHLLIGVPQRPEGALRATHFDHIDKEQAHCVSGNSLTPGNYPVGTAIPHPEGQPVVFHLINLPTPRHRLAYEYQVKRSEAERLEAISHRTLREIIAKKRHLSENDMIMLAQLDPRVVSNYVGQYFANVPDEPLTGTNYRITGQPTEHLALCFVLAAIGTREAIPALEKLASGPPADADEISPHQIAWLAALAILERDPWKDADPWLAGLVERTDLLGMGGDPSPELGATAAALLLERQHESARPFGLMAVNDPLLQRMGIPSYRFTAPDKRAEVLRWWKQRKREPMPAT